MAKATLAAGCFWGVEAQFQQITGVSSTRVGYLGGTTTNPDYNSVCTGSTGHAEVIEISFDSAIISFESLLDIFWQLHDPTTLNRQGPDIGSQYRSAIFYHDEQQQQIALASKQALIKSHRYAVTEITAVSTFYPAEDYHQCYIAKKRSGPNA